MSKRTASTELNHDNWDKEEPPEEAGVFKTATPEVIGKRVIRTAKRRIGMTSPMLCKNTPETEEKKAFSSFSGFGLPANNQNSEVAKPNFSFLSNSNGMSKQNSPLKVFSNETRETSQKISSSNSEKTNEKKSSYYVKLKELNEGLLDWVNLHVKKDPYCILTPVFKDYERHLDTISKEEETAKVANNTSLESQSSSNSEFTNEKTFTIPSTVATNMLSSFKNSNTEKASSFFQQTQSPFASKLVNEKGSGDSPLKPPPSIFGSTPFSFTGGKSFTFGNVSAPPKEQNDQENETEETDEPPKNDFKPVTEEDAVYSQRVKLFVKKDGSFSDRGVGMLYIKPAGGKHQVVMRADTSLGNVLLNILLTESVPSQRVGKNNVMLVCIPTPDSKPPPVPILLRVKTEKDADNLLGKIDKYKK